LDMGFADAVDELISNVYTQEPRPQTLFFSATVPKWVKGNIYYSYNRILTLAH